MRILILGAGGMLGSAMFNVLSEAEDLEVFGTLRSPEGRKFFPKQRANWLLGGCDVENVGNLIQIFRDVKPDVVINCVALSRNLEKTMNPMTHLSIYAVLPQRLAQLCGAVGARLIQIGTDGVFSGAKGNYTEDDLPEPKDLYGVAKFLGEPRDKHVLTLRTSVIGHPLQGDHGLIGWFLSQQGSCRCYTKAIFSGFPASVLAEIVRHRIIPRPELSGMYHVASQPVSKYDLLALVARQYGKKIDLVADESVVMDRSLNGSRFREATGYVSPEWPELISLMHSYQSSQRASNV
jgi:dTDP-4-dehydrorhamnose reductase